MRAVTRDQLLTLIGMTSGGLDAQQRAGYVALAFGSSNPAMPGRYCDLDLVGMAIANRFAPALGRPIATKLTLGFFDQWVATVGQADADKRSKSSARNCSHSVMMTRASAPSAQA